jgi:hypothetical protein
MSVAIATRGIIAGFGGGTVGEPYPVDAGIVELVTLDINLPFIDVDPELEETIPIDFEEVEEYYPEKRSTIVTKPSKAGLRTFPEPGNL